MNEPAPTETDTGGAVPAATGSDAARGELQRGEQVGRYLVVEPLGRGGMGVVYRAYDPELDRTVAIKVVAEAEEGTDRRSVRLLREGQALARLSHPNVVAVHDVGTLEGGKVYIAVELVVGVTLRAWVRAGDRSSTELLEILVQAGRGLAAAHAAGVVHRDFKPSNVMVDGEGRARVLDFGIARPLPDVARPRSRAVSKLADGSTAMEALVTSAGAVSGTPAYMPPEQLAGEETDARSDQYAFALTCWELLSGTRPDREAEVLEVPRGTGTPRAVWRALQRARDHDPERRFEDMPALLAELERSARRRSYAWPAVVLAAGATGLGVWIATRPEPCPDQRAYTDGLWLPHRDDVRAAFAATSAPNADETFELVDESVGRYLERWQDAQRRACEDTHVRRTHSVALYDARMRCLRDGAARVEALAGTFRSADASTMRKAVAAVSGLPDLGRCADEARLARGVPLPDDPARVEAIEALERELRELTSLSNTGRPDEVVPRLDEALPEAREVGYDPLVAHFDALRILTLVQLGKNDEALDACEDAIPRAAAVADPELVLDLWLHFANLQRGAGQLPRAHDGILAARAAAQAPGIAPRKLARLEREEARLLMEGGDLVGAEALARKAIAIYEEHDPDHHLYPQAVETLAHVLMYRAQWDAWYAEADRALQLKRSIFGERSPFVAESLVNLAVGLNAAERYEEALTALERGIELLILTYGDAHEGVAVSEVNRGLILLRLQRYEESAAASERAAELITALGGPDDPRLPAAWANRAGALAALEDLPPAIALMERATDLLQKTYGTKPSPQLVDALSDLADLERSDGRLEDALVHAQRARDAAEALYPDDPVKRVPAWHVLGEVLLSLGRRDDAIASLETAQGLAADDHQGARDAIEASLQRAREGSAGH